MLLMEFSFDGLVLRSGNHSSRDSGVCLLEAAAWMAGEEHSDAPKCVCPVLAAFGRSLNDAMGDEARQSLIPLIPKLLNTRGAQELRFRRAEFLARSAVCEFLPIALEVAGDKKHSGRLRRMKARSLAKLELECRIVADAYAADADATYAAA